jgi:hypothetical protein
MAIYSRAGIKEAAGTGGNRRYPYFEMTPNSRIRLLEKIMRHILPLRCERIREMESRYCGYRTQPVVPVIYRSLVS